MLSCRIEAEYVTFEGRSWSGGCRGVGQDCNFLKQQVNHWIVFCWSVIPGSVGSVFSHVFRWPPLSAHFVVCPLTPRKWSAPPVWRSSLPHSKHPAGAAARRYILDLYYPCCQITSVPPLIWHQYHLADINYSVIDWLQDIIYASLCCVPVLRWLWWRWGPTLFLVLKYRNRSPTAPNLSLSYPRPNQYQGTPPFIKETTTNAVYVERDQLILTVTQNQLNTAALLTPPHKCYGNNKK